VDRPLTTQYIFLFQAISFAIIAIYFSQVHSWDPIFETSLGVQANAVDKTWFSLFVTVSAYTGTGLKSVSPLPAYFLSSSISLTSVDSLLDQSFTPLMGSYLVIYVLNMVMLAGNHALPMMLRFSLWLLTKIWRKGEINETLHFLLDHPRR
jgi:Trk-type K+ transport system membrane component